MSIVSLVEFEAILESVKKWGRWGPEDELGTFNYITLRLRPAALVLGAAQAGRRR